MPKQLPLNINYRIFTPMTLSLKNFLWLCLGWLTVNAQAQPQNFLQYTLQDGLPQSQVYAITEDSDGYLWVGTQGGGLARFDGHSFESVLIDLPDRYINALVSDSAGRIWIGTHSGLTILSKDTTISIPLAQKVTTLKLDNQGLMWIGTEKGLFQIDTKSPHLRLKKYTQLKNNSIRSFYFADNEKWAATNTGAWKLNSNQKISIHNGLENNDVQAIYRDILGRLWVATFDGRITLFDEASFAPIESIKIPYQGHPQLISQVDNQIWVGTINNGIAAYNIDTKRWMMIDERFGLAAKNIKTLFRDSWNNLWLGTSGDGLLKSVGQEFVRFGIQSGLKGDNIYAVFHDSQNRIWLSESGYGVSVLDSSGLHHFGDQEGFARVKCKAIAEDPKGRIWLGTDGRGIAYRDTSGFHFLSEKDGLPSNWVNSLAIDSLGQVWAGTYGNGIAKIIDKDSAGFQIFPYGKAEGLPELKIQSIKIDPQGHLWFSTRSGHLGFYQIDFEPVIFDTQNGLPNVDIRALAFRNNQVWVGTAGKGLYHANRQEKPVHFAKVNLSKSETSPQMSGNIYLLHFSKDNQLWVGTERGLNRLTLNYKSQVIDFKHFGKEEGFLGIETCQNAITQDHDHNLWIGTMNGLMKYQASLNQQAIRPPKLHFADIQLFYQSLQTTPYKNWVSPNGGLKKGLSLPYDKNHLGFKLAGLNLARPNQVKYRWQLAGSETQWSPLSTAHTINYAKLDPGTYVFKAQACITPENCSPVLTAPFVIQKPFWQKWWFRLTILGGFLLFSFLFYKLRVQAIRRQEAAKRKELELKNHLLTVEQKALQLQMNPHFIFNALNSINGLVALKDFAQARKQINRFAILMRQILSNSRKETISLEEEIKTLENYLAMEQFCRPNTFEYRIQVADPLNTEEIEVPPMIIQPFVENAIIHGVAHLQKPGLVQIRFDRQGEVLRCIITDNGIGRKKSAELRKKRSPSHQSTAMAVTQERLDALFAANPGRSIEISDIVDKNGETQGTKVLLRIPLIEN